MKKVLISLVLCTLALFADAQVSMRDIWLSMPDSILPYLNKNLRMEHLDFVDMHVKSEVKNLLHEEGVLDTLTTDFAAYYLPQSSSLEMKLLTMADSAQVLCVVKTVMAPEAESEIRFFDTNWKPVAGNFGLPVQASESEIMKQFTSKPTDMTDDRFSELRDMIDPVMLSASLSVSSPDITVCLSVPVLTSDERKEVSVIVKQISFKWDGIKYKEY
jgi:hypothetical protein